MREWMDHRQAYFPRIWPWLAPGALVAGGIAALVVEALDLNLWIGTLAGMAIGVLVGWGGVRLRLAVWRRRHPELSIEEYAQRLRAQMAETARWN